MIIEEQLKAWMAGHLEHRRSRIRDELIRRVKLAKAGRMNPALAREVSRRDPVTFINDWVWTFDPRNPADGIPARIPLYLRPRQAEFIVWVDERISAKQNGVIEKSRDEGMTWVICALFIHHWLFQPGFKAGIGSRKLDLVDRKDDPDSIFEKLRFILRNLPKWMLPKGYDEGKHANYCRLVNPENGASIVGEGGDDIGRGGRNTVYFVDEHAKLERAQLVEASLSQNAPTILYGSTPRGVGNLFYQKRHAPGAYVFTFHWRDNPDKNYYVLWNGKIFYPWYEWQKSKFDPITIAQEIDIDYTASVAGVVIPAAWVQAALELDLPAGYPSRAGLDVSDEITGNEGDKTVYASRSGPRVLRVEEIRGGGLAGAVRERAIMDHCEQLTYDRLGVGASITATLAREEGLPFRVVGVANSERPTPTKYPDLPEVRANDRFANYAAELWWRLRLRFQASYERRQGIKDHPDEECISLAGLRGHPALPTILAQLSQPTYDRIGSTDKIRVNKKGDTTTSPDYAEAIMYAFAEGRRPHEEEESGTWSYRTMS